MATEVKRERRERLRQERLEGERQRERAERLRKLRLRVAIVVGVAVIALGGVFALANRPGPSLAGDSAARGSSATKAEGRQDGKYPFAVGDPGPGQAAPALALPSTAGNTFDLGKQRGQTVLLYFQEGVGCQPCWDQIRDLEAQDGKLRALGIDKMVSITTDPLDQLRQKVADEGISTPLLSDPDLAVSAAYDANQYGMMGTSRDGHSFMVVGPDGRIKQRADYGGEPNYTMYVPLPTLLADLKEGLSGTRS